MIPCISCGCIYICEFVERLSRGDSFEAAYVVGYSGMSGDRLQGMQRLYIVGMGVVLEFSHLIT